MITNLKYRGSEASFDDLIDAVTQAYKDGVISKIKLDDDGIGFSNKTKSFWAINREYRDYSDNIKKVKSLYIETFELDDLDSLRRVKDGAEGVLTNGSKFKVLKGSYKFVGEKQLFVEFVSEEKNYATLDILKGALITQNKYE